MTDYLERLLDLLVWEEGETAVLEYTSLALPLWQGQGGEGVDGGEQSIPSAQLAYGVMASQRGAVDVGWGELPWLGTVEPGEGLTRNMTDSAVEGAVLEGVAGRISPWISGDGGVDDSGFQNAIQRPTEGDTWLAEASQRSRNSVQYAERSGSRAAATPQAGAVSSQGGTEVNWPLGIGSSRGQAIVDGDDSWLSQARGYTPFTRGAGGRQDETARVVDRAFQRDARRYDGGFQLD